MKSKKIVVNPPAYLFLFLLLALGLHFLLPLYRLPGVFRLVGGTLLLAGIVLNLWADRLFSKKQTTVKPAGQPSVFITTGPFAFSRHPMYLGFGLILLGSGLLLGSVSTLIAPTLLFWVLGKKYLPLEEKKMNQVFGQKYRDYQKQVRKWL